MSSMRNAVQRRVHRERGQPEERKKWGLLEKHKDYSARARDFNTKKRKLQALRQKVLEKNPDEFYFGMMSRSGPSTGKGSTGTVSADRGNKVLSQEAVRLFKTQDLGYIRTARNKAVKEVERLEIAVKGITGKGQKVIFLADPNQKIGKIELESNNTLDGNEDDDEGDDDDEGEMSSSKEEKDLQRTSNRQAEKIKLRLITARERLKALTDAENALELQRSRMAKSPTVGGITKHGTKFKVRDRKR
ncbi:hypothetical protein K3495_g7304 [Podosphaera aphanis]|nr:hypothetical protein K3495_g7304 [Podosphaera aphanis]